MDSLWPLASSLCRHGRSKVLRNLHSQYLFLSTTAKNLANPYPTLPLLPFCAGRGHLKNPEFQLPVIVTGSLLFLYHFCTPFLIFPGDPPPTYAGAYFQSPLLRKPSPREAGQGSRLQKVSLLYLCKSHAQIHQDWNTRCLQTFGQTCLAAMRLCGTFGGLYMTSGNSQCSCAGLRTRLQTIWAWKTSLSKCRRQCSAADAEAQR